MSNSFFYLSAFSHSTLFLTRHSYIIVDCHAATSFPCGNTWFSAIFIFKRCLLNPMSFLVIFKCTVYDHWIIEFQTDFFRHRTDWTLYKNIIFPKRFLKIFQVFYAKLRYLVGYRDIYKT